MCSLQCILLYVKHSNKLLESSIKKYIVSLRNVDFKLNKLEPSSYFGAKFISSLFAIDNNYLHSGLTVNFNNNMNFKEFIYIFVTN